jgi:hypothetical protein
MKIAFVVQPRARPAQPDDLFVSCRKMSFHFNHTILIQGLILKFILGFGKYF